MGLENKLMKIQSTKTALKPTLKEIFIQGGPIKCYH